ncbi:MAG: FkbM family methyltransferase [Reichenbachiella sp.]|uniref:FkbM family methyltransferase n=1 Tax=Reichenbachiella sp. TaxID=2184521 RepID=UPI002967490D|nr:FkbM family methyltransferase [Reichenbachiella sp.]MDW3211325.1 FkbM family methyltransferase [Reichenbachiella sp.]
MRAFLRRAFHHQLYGNGYSRARFSLLGIFIQECKVIFTQFFSWRFPIFSLYRLVVIFISSIVRLLLGRSLKYSFGFSGEDRILEGIYKPVIDRPGYYVDVGCNHPVFLSNTYGLYRKGWRGLCIDANEDLIKKHRKYRPKDLAICALVSNEEKEREFYKVSNDGLSTTEKGNLAEQEIQRLGYQTETHHSKTLTSILRDAGAPEHIDILSIDVEEHDFQVLQSLDFNAFKPKVIVIEDETFDVYDARDHRIVDFLIARGYDLEGYVLKNLYFSLKKSI